MDCEAKSSHLLSAGGSSGCDDDDDGIRTPSKTDEEMKVIDLRTCGQPFFQTCIYLFFTDTKEHPESSACGTIADGIGGALFSISK